MKTSAEYKLPVFAQRFHKLREDKGMSQDAFSKFLEISRPTVGFYENGERLPDAAVLKQICKKCKVSADYLLGISDAATTNMTIKGICAWTGLGEDAVYRLLMYKGSLAPLPNNPTFHIAEGFTSFERKITLEFISSFITYSDYAFHKI